MDWVLPVSTSVIVGAIIKWIWDRKSLYSTWKRLGIDGPKPSSLFLGSIGDIVANGRYPMCAKWTEKYGKLFGYYEGGVPVLYIGDPDMVKEILIKQFDNFMTRRLLFDSTNDPYAHLVDASGERWKRLRIKSHPTFSLKQMEILSPLFQKSVDKLVQKLSNSCEKKEDFDIFQDTKVLSLDVIASAVFSYDTNFFTEKDNIFAQKMGELFATLSPSNFTVFEKLKFLIFIAFPGFLSFVQMINPRILVMKNEWFLELAKTLIKERQASGEVKEDYIQLLLGTDTEKENEDGTTSTAEYQTASSIKLSMEEMQGQVFVFVAAGYETMASTLAFTCYYLALYPKIQAKLQQEIDQHVPIGDKVCDYDTVRKLPYLEMVLSEASRLASAGQFGVQRICGKESQVGDLTIPKGTKIMVNIMNLHMNPELWGPEPTDEFVPERFLPERKTARHSMAYLHFGAGRRDCIGGPFAQLEAKMALVKILQRFTILKTDKTQVPLETTKNAVRGPAEGVYVRLNARR